MANKPMSELGLAALAYARRGIPVFPCLPGGKTPLTRRGFFDASAEADAVEAWWKTRPHANIGMPTGDACGFWVLDVDVKNPDASGVDSLNKLVSQYGTLPETLTALTPSGGWHYCFYSDTMPASRGGLRPGLDIRGRGGYIVIAPSVVGGKKYRWLAPSPVAAAPDWLAEIVLKKQMRLLEQPEGQGWTPIEGRNNYLSRVAGKCRSDGMALEETRAFVLAANARFGQPLELEEIERTVLKSAKNWPRMAAVVKEEQKILDNDQ
jgi:hypothetical protein